jgi:antitoxin HicB
MTYKAYLTLDDGRFLVRFFDIPEALTDGATQAEALANAGDALSAALEGYLEAGRPFPVATEILPDTAAPGFIHHDVAVEPAIAARAILTREMKAQGLSKIGLARRMRKDEKIVRRILTGKGASLDLTIQALRAIGVRPALAT